jgi:CDP-diacylglycerol--glycerol-3-phosphate 3-phosphatidyltransferase
VPFIGGGLWLLLERGLSAALQGGLQTAAVMVYGWTRWGRALALNHPPQEPRLRPSLGAANWLTLLRGGLIAVLAGFVFQPTLAGGSLAGWVAWAPAALYIAAAALDGADGFLARVTGSETCLGAPRHRSRRASAS